MLGRGVGGCRPLPRAACACSGSFLAAVTHDPSSVAENSTMYFLTVLEVRRPESFSPGWSPGVGRAVPSWASPTLPLLGESFPAPAASGGAHISPTAALPCMTAITGLPPSHQASSPTPPHSPQLRAPDPVGSASLPTSCSGSNLSLLTPPSFEEPVCVCWAHVDGSGSCSHLKTPHHCCRMPPTGHAGGGSRHT